MGKSTRLNQFDKIPKFTSEKILILSRTNFLNTNKCASVQSDQRLCYYLFFEKYHIKTIFNKIRHALNKKLHTELGTDLVDVGKKIK